MNTNIFPTATTATSMSTPNPSRQSAHLIRRRESFIKAAQKVLGTIGPTATIEEFATAAGVTVATLYNHFPSKDSFIQIAFLDAADSWEGWMRNAASTLADPADRLVCSFRLVLRMPSTHPDLARLGAIAMSNDSPIVLTMVENASIQIGEVSEALQRELTIPGKRLQSFFAALRAEFQQQVLSRDEQAADEVVELLLPLLGFSPTEAHDLVSRKLP